MLVSGPDIAVPTVDATDHWVLFGLLSGKARVPGLPAAEPAPMPPGAARLCLPAGEACRPLAGRVAGSGAARRARRAHLVPAARATALPVRVAGALALRRGDGALPAPRRSGAGHLGRAASSSWWGGSRATRRRGSESRVLFVVREVKGTRLKAVRVVATPAHDGGGHAFHLQRAEVSLAAGPRVFAWEMRPLRWR